jgi:hypothetical protein
MFSSDRLKSPKFGRTKQGLFLGKLVELEGAGSLPPSDKVRLSNFPTEEFEFSLSLLLTLPKLSVTLRSKFRMKKVREENLFLSLIPLRRKDSRHVTKHVFSLHKEPDEKLSGHFGIPLRGKPPVFQGTHF